jgi:hypothetical protein
MWEYTLTCRSDPILLLAQVFRLWQGHISQRMLEEGVAPGLVRLQNHLQDVANTESCRSLWMQDKRPNSKR